MTVSLNGIRVRSQPESPSQISTGSATATPVQAHIAEIANNILRSILVPPLFSRSNADGPTR
ncbi:hypothetical protein ACFOHS_19810 [Jhaorihella thermophila]